MTLTRGAVLVPRSYFSNVELPCNLTATLDPAEALRGVKLIGNNLPARSVIIKNPPVSIQLP
jgi:hypothetical protein